MTRSRTRAVAHVQLALACALLGSADAPDKLDVVLALIDASKHAEARALYRLALAASADEAACEGFIHAIAELIVGRFHLVRGGEPTPLRRVERPVLRVIGGGALVSTADVNALR